MDMKPLHTDVAMQMYTLPLRHSAAHCEEHAPSRLQQQCETCNPTIGTSPFEIRNVNVEESWDCEHISVLVDIEKRCRVLHNLERRFTTHALLAFTKALAWLAMRLLGAVKVLQATAGVEAKTPLRRCP